MAGSVKQQCVDRQSIRFRAVPAPEQDILRSNRDRFVPHYGIIPYIGSVPLESVTTGMIQKLYNDMMKREWRPAVYKKVNGMEVEVSPAKTYSAKTVRNVHSALKQALDQAVRTNLIYRNPCDYVQLPKKENIDYVIPTPEQLKSLLKALSEHAAYYPILICAVLGCRRGEALGLQWQDIDFKQNTIQFRRAYIYNSLKKCNEIGELKTKNSRRILPLPEMLKTELLKLKERNVGICKMLGVEIPYLCINNAGQMLTPNLCSHHFHYAAILLRTFLCRSAFQIRRRALFQR